MTPQTDLYALGCVLFELLSGQPPLMGDTPAATLHMHCKTPPPRVTQFALDCPPSLEKLILDLMEKQAADRPPDATTVMHRLRAITPEVTLVTRPRLERSSGSGSGAGSDMLRTTKAATDSLSAGTRLPTWLLIIWLASMAALFAWNLRLQQAQRLADRAETLWVAAASDPQTTVRERALRALGELGSVGDLGDESVEALARGAADHESSVRLAAVQALGEMGSQASSQVPGLVRVQKTDADEAVRSAAQASLTAIQEGAGQSRWAAILIRWLLALGGLVGAVALIRRFRPEWLALDA